MPKVVEKCVECGAELVHDPVRGVMFCPDCNPVETSDVEEEMEEEA